MTDFLSSNYKRTGQSDEIRFCCPYCGDTGYHLYFNITHKIYHCFRCGCSGKVKDIKDLDYIYPDTHIDKVITAPKKEEKRLIDIIGDSFIQKVALKYWKMRGLTEQEIYDFKVKLRPKNWSLVFPVFDEKDKHVFDIERKIFNCENPYYIDKGTEKKKVLYNLNQAKKCELIYLCEGVFDVISVGKNAVGLLGKVLSQEMVELLKKSKIKKIYILLDKDAKEDATKIWNMLLPYFDVKQIDIRRTGYKDIAELREKEGKNKMLTWLEIEEYSTTSKWEIIWKKKKEEKCQQKTQSKK